MKRSEMKEAIANPTKVFDEPADVVNAALPTATKQKILKNWEDEAKQLMAAADENMTGGEPSRIDDVRKAIDAVAEDEKVD